MAAVDRSFARTTAAQSRTGNGLKALETQQTRTGDLRRASENRADGLEKVNLAEAITRMSQADTAYKAALGAIGASGKVTLMDYL
jgi:flagellin-like hook-associated protein FlgL